jgi:hypothetical protein
MAELRASIARRARKLALRHAVTTPSHDLCILILVTLLVTALYTGQL